MKLTTRAVESYFERCRRLRREPSRPLVALIPTGVAGGNLLGKTVPALEARGYRVERINEHYIRIHDRQEAEA